MPAPEIHELVNSLITVAETETPTAFSRWVVVLAHKLRSALPASVEGEPIVEQQAEWLDNYEKHMTAIAESAGVRLNGSEHQWSDMTREVVARIPAASAEGREQALIGRGRASREALSFLLKLGYTWRSDTGWTKALQEAGAAPASAWQPMETAPKDSTVPIIVFAADYAEPVIPVNWDDDEASEGGQCWRVCDAMNDRVTPTHWMPLPSAPLVSPQGEE